MRAERESLGNRVYGVRIVRCARIPDARTVLYGFDVKYRVTGAGRENEPICWAIYDGRRGHLMPLSGKLKLSDLTAALLELRDATDPQAHHVVLASWFAQAELSVIENDMKATLMHQSGGLFGLRWHVNLSRRRRVTFTIFDLCAMYGRKELGEFAPFGVPELKWDKAANLSDRKFCAYAVNDAHICSALGEQLDGEFLRGWGLNPFRFQSVGHIGSSIFRHYYLLKDVMQPHPDVRELALIAYRGSGDYGGCWARGVMPGQWGEYDAVSMYPSSAAKLGFLPTREDWWAWTPGTDWPETGLYRAQITWPEGVKRTLMAIVPGLDGAESYGYPRQAVDVWTGFELKAAEKLGCQVRIISGRWYETGSDALPMLMSHLTVKRAQHKRDGCALESVYKNLANTLIGKLGQHRGHVGYSLQWDEPSRALQVRRNDTQFSSYGSVFAPEWWCLIVGYARSVMMGVIAEFDAVHCNVDAVLLELDVPEFERGGLTFRRKSGGDLLRLAARNLWQLERGGAVLRFAAALGRDLTELRSAFQGWTGEALSVPYTATDLVTIPLHAADRERYPLNTHREVELTFNIPALDGGTDEHGRAGGEK